MIPEVIEHCMAVMGHYNPVRDCCSIQDFWIAHAYQFGISGRGEIDCGLLLPNGPYDVEVEI